jgi:hypothetical protein
MMAGQALALDPATFRLTNGSNLLELCSLPAEDPLHDRAMEFCNGYLTGSYHYYNATALASNRFVCAPNPTPTPTEVMSGFVTWAKAHPKYMDDRAIDALFRYLGETYPCKD